MLQHLKHLLHEDWKLTGQSRFAKQAKTSLPEGNELEFYQVRLCEVYINVYFYNISSLFLGRGEGEGGICCYPCRVEEAVHIKLYLNNINRADGKEIPDTWKPRWRGHNRRLIQQQTAKGTHLWNAPSTAKHDASSKWSITMNQSTLQIIKD